MHAEISEGDIKLIRVALKLVPPKDLGFWESKVPVTLNKSSFQFLSVRRCLGSE